MAKTKKTDDAGLIDVRVLVDCDAGRANDVAAITQEQLDAAPAGCFDAEPKAVAYALTLPQNAE